MAADDSCIFASKYGIDTEDNDPLVVSCDIWMVNTLDSSCGAGVILAAVDVVFDVGRENDGKLAAGISTVVTTTGAAPKDDVRLNEVVPLGSVMETATALSFALERSTYKPPRVAPCENVFTEVCDEEDSSASVTKSAIRSMTTDAFTTVGRDEDLMLSGVRCEDGVRVGCSDGCPVG